MKLFLTDQQARFRQHLEQLAKVPVAPYRSAGLVEKRSSIHLPVTPDLLQRAADVLFSYRIFPSRILRCYGEWTASGRPMQPGDTIVQQAYIPPFGSFSQKLIFGVRIDSIIREESRLGFSYETLEGHAERGRSIFTVEAQNGRARFVIHTFSEPGNFLTKLLGPLVTVPYQAWCTKAALQYVHEQLSGCP
ncbi:DUF1990 domain-containing protein [Flaviaesturariibacter terrae]